MTQGTLLRGSLLLVVLLVIRRSSAKALSHGFPVTVSNGYNYRFLFDISMLDHVVFTIRACSNIHIALTKDSTTTDSNIYEICIGGWNNQKSAIRPEKQGDNWAQQDTRDILSCSAARPFWISWASDYIRVGQGWQVRQAEFMNFQYTSRGHIFPFNYLAATAWRGITAQFEFFPECPTLPAIPSGFRTCNSSVENVYNSACQHQCLSGFQLQGSSTLQCRLNGYRLQWDFSMPTCQQCPTLPAIPFGLRTCNGSVENAYNSACHHQCLSGFHLQGPSTLQCRRNGYRLEWDVSMPTCQLATPPVLNTCQVTHVGEGNTDKESGHVGNSTDCSHQRDEVVNTQPISLRFKIAAFLNFSVSNDSNQSHVLRSQIGVVGTNVSVIKMSLRAFSLFAGAETTIASQDFNGSPFCTKNVSSLNPLMYGFPLECEDNMSITTTMQDGERLCVKMESFAGGYYTPADGSGNNHELNLVSASRRVCFLYDDSRPVHCSEGGCGSEPLQLSTRITRSPQINVHVEGWKDPIPAGGNETSASHIHQYKLEIHNVLTDSKPLAVEHKARANFSREWNHGDSSNGSYDVTLTLPDEQPRLYAVLLEVHDNAGEHGNVAYARRFVLYDNSSAVEFNGTLTAVSAEARTNFLWQTDVSQDICVNWTGQFYNKYMIQNNFLLPIKADNSTNITGHYEQTSGILPDTGTDNVKGIIKFEMSWKREGETQTPFKEIADFHSQSSCLSAPLKDGEAYQVWVRATDIMGNTKMTSTVVHIDHTGPQVSVQGLQGRLGRDGLYVHNSTALSTMTLGVHASDPQSGLYTLQIFVGTLYMSSDVTQYSHGVQRLDNTTICSGQRFCYCPVEGPCENYEYAIAFDKVINVNNSQGLHHREYYVTIRATNNARLVTTEHVDILIDASPPTVGVALEGLSDDVKAEMDFTSSEDIHVRWHGFTDQESGIMSYRIALAERCLSIEELETITNATEISGDTYSAILQFPAEGHYYSSVVGYNGAMQPSPVACSDGIQFDNTAPILLNVSLYHSRSGRVIACTLSNEAWLINSNLTRRRLSDTAACQTKCSASSSVIDVSHLPVTSNMFLEEELSDDLCQRLTVWRDDHHILLPSDYVRLDWVGQDEESDMEEFFVGMGRDRSTFSAPDLLDYTPTHGHHSYHARHSGLAHGAVFFIFLRALNKAGLQTQLTLGPVIVDCTPPEVTTPLHAETKNGFIIVTWTNATFVDPEQPQGVNFESSFRIGHDAGFVTPLLNLPEGFFASYALKNVTGIARYPIAALQSHDTENGRSFFFQLHVTNEAGHVTSVNTSGTRLPAHLPPSHGVVIDVIRISATSTETSNSNQNNTSSTVMSPSATVSPSWSEFSKDIDVILQRDEVCIAWSGLSRAVDNIVEVGVGSSRDQANLISFSSIGDNGPVCFNGSNLPPYTKLYSVIRASNSGGATVFSSDGFQMVPRNDSENIFKVHNGKGCARHDVIGTHRLHFSDGMLNLSAVAEVPLHPGDILFVRVTPFDGNLTFPDAKVLQTTLTGYQIVTKQAFLTANIPPSIVENSTLELMNCLVDIAFLTDSNMAFDVSWEIVGPWSNLIKIVEVEIMDEGCLKTSVKKGKYIHHQCLVASHSLSPAKNWTRLAGHILSDHRYIASVSLCFDVECMPPVRPKVIIYDSEPRTLILRRSEIMSQTMVQTEMRFNAELEPALENEVDQHRPCVFRWSLGRDRHGSTVLLDWEVGETRSCSNIGVQQVIDSASIPEGTLYLCLQIVYPLKLENPTCKLLQRPRSLSTRNSFHLIELAHSTLSGVNVADFTHSRQLGSRLQQLYDLDVDFVSSTNSLSAILSDGDERDVTWFLMTDQRVPSDGNCVADDDCVSLRTSHTGSIVFSSGVSTLQDGQSYYVCALVPLERINETNILGTNNLITRTEVCGDGVIIDDTPPKPGTVLIRNTESGYLNHEDNVLVTWGGFSDDVLQGTPSAAPVLNYSVCLGSYPGTEDIARCLSVGQRNTWMFDRLFVTPGLSCYATVKAEDRVGLVTQVSSDVVIIDTIPPVIGHLIAGKVTQQKFVSARELPVHWDTVDAESGVQTIEIGLVSEGGQFVLPFQPCQGTSSILFPITGQLTDGHSYMLLLKVTNGAGLTSIKSSESFVVDGSPPNLGVVWNSGKNRSTQASYSTEVGIYSVHWSEFSDPHSGLAYFRVGLGSAANQVDVHPFINVGLQTSYTWKGEFEQGKNYYVTVEACNRAGLCRMTSSNSMTLDNSPPLAGRVSVGYDGGHHSKFLAHKSSLPVHWAGFSDPQSGIAEFWWCAGTKPRACDVIPSCHTMLSRGTLKAGLALPEGVHLWVTVQARNSAGLETECVSDSFQVDSTPPVVIKKPQFLSPPDGRIILRQWDRSLLRLAWQFKDDESKVVSHSVNIRSKLTGRLVKDTVVLASETELTLPLNQDELLLDGDSHWALVTACNAAGLCSSSGSDLLLIDASPPVAGTFVSPLTWHTLTSARYGRSVSALRLTWRAFLDAESDVSGYEITVGRAYNGEDLSDGVVRVLHDNATLDQSLMLELADVLQSGEIIYLGIRGNNPLGLSSTTVRTAYSVLPGSFNKTSGTLLLIRHSCDAAYCTNECSCAASGTRCSGTSACQQPGSGPGNLAGFSLTPYIGERSSPQLYSSSGKCLEGHWSLQDPASVYNVSRFEWSFSLFNKTYGEGVFDSSEPTWYDVGRANHTVFCLAGVRVFQTSLKYVLHVRAWLTRDYALTFTSQPVIIDQTPPKQAKGNTVIECGVTCNKDIDYITTELYVTASWDDVFQDSDSLIVRYEVWVGSLSFGSDYLAERDAALNTSIRIPTTDMKEGTRYHVSVRAWNAAGLQTTVVSDGVIMDVTPPVKGVVFASRYYSSRHAQSSTTSMAVSWHGFEDRHSGVTSCHVALHDADDDTTPVVPYTDVGFRTQFVFNGLTLRPGHRYHVSVKARDKAGLESAAANSTHILIDATPPEGVTCVNFTLQEEITLDFVPTSGFLADSYTGVLQVGPILAQELLKIQLLAVNLDHGAGGYVEMEELKMPLYFVNQQSVKATAEHIFMSPSAQNTTLDLRAIVEGKYGAVVKAKLFRCLLLERSPASAITVQQLSQNVISVCARVLDEESGIRSLKIGLGTTESGQQVHPMTYVGHSGHVQFPVKVQHGILLYASVIAENHAGQLSRFVSQPIIMDRTGPVISDVEVTVRYEDEGPDKADGSVWVEAEWSAEDQESLVTSCTCLLEGHRSHSPIQQTTTNVMAAKCQWLLGEPRHGATVNVAVTCVNQMQIETRATSLPAMLLLQPPDLSHVSIIPLSNSETLSPYDCSNPHIQSGNSSLQFHWTGLNDPTITQVHYRFLHKLQPLTDWRPLPVVKTSAVLAVGNKARWPMGEIIVQLRAENNRHMTHNVSKTVVIENSMPSLTGNGASLVVNNSQLQLDWRNVFNKHHDVTFSVFAGSAEGYGDVMNHLTTKTTSVTVPYLKEVTDVYVTIQAVDPNGAVAVYKDEIKI